MLSTLFSVYLKFLNFSPLWNALIQAKIIMITLSWYLILSYFNYLTSLIQASMLDFCIKRISPSSSSTIKARKARKGSVSPVSTTLFIASNVLTANKKTLPPSYPHVPSPSDGQLNLIYKGFHGGPVTCMDICLHRPIFVSASR